MRIQDIPAQTAGQGQVLVRLGSSRINPVDHDLMRGIPFLRYAKPTIGGVDGAGIIIDIGRGVEGWYRGDAVCFYRLFTDLGTWAEEIAIDAEFIARVPASWSAEQAGGVVLPLLTAYDCLRQLDTKPGERILIHGAGGGVGFMAVQVAVAMGLHVTGTAGAGDEAVLKSLGMARSIDYRREDFAKVLAPGSVEYVLDLLGKDVLQRSIALRPRRVISVHFIEAHKMSQTGLKMPKPLLWLLQWSTAKFARQARRLGVELIGQVTGGDGCLLEEACRFAESHHFTLPQARTIDLAEISRRGLSNKDVGRTIVFPLP